MSWQGVLMMMMMMMMVLMIMMRMRMMMRGAMLERMMLSHPMLLRLN